MNKVKIALTILTIAITVGPLSRRSLHLQG